MKRYILLFLCLASSSQTSRLYGFTLDRAERYAQSMPELPEVIGPSYLLNPDYSRWHRQQKPSTFWQILEMIGLKTPAWSSRLFIELLSECTAAQKEAGLDRPHTLVITPSPGSEFIIFGPVFGAYHSLVRSLSELVKQGLLTTDFTLTKPHSSIIFTGNITNGSPYNMETLTLVMALMKANPRQVIYLASKQEIDDAWLGYGLKKELAERAGDSGLEKEVSSFFSTLPRALFIQGDKDSDIIKIGDGTAEAPCPSRLRDTFEVCSQEDGEPQEIQTRITGEKRLMSYKNHSGLAQAPAVEGALTWAVFSAPNKLYQEHFSFVHDAFVVLTIGKSLSQSVLALYSQHAQELGGFKKGARYAVMTGKSLLVPQLEIAPHENRFIPDAGLIKRLKDCNELSDLELGAKLTKEAEQEPLYIGCTIDLTKGASPLGKRVRDGVALRINKLNAEGGIRGRPVKVVFMDDEYSPEMARINVEEFMKEYKSNLFLCSLGSPTLQAYVDMVKDEKIFLFFPITGAPLFRKPDIKGIVHWRASYKTEAQIITQYMINEFRIRNFAFLYQNDSYGLGALEGSNAVMKKEGISEFVNVRYERNTTSFDAQIKAVKDAAATGLGFFSTSLAATEFIRQAGVDSFIGKKLFALSDLAEESFTKFVALRGLDMVIAQFAPNPETSMLSLVKEFRHELLLQGDTFADVFTLEGYISASLMIYILNKTQDLSPQALNKMINGIKDVTYKGLPLSFNEDTREIAHELWIDTGAPEWIRQQVKVVA